MIFMCFIIVLNKPLLNGYSSKEGTMCVLVHWNKIGYSDLEKVQNYCKYVKNLPLRSSIRRWHKKFKETSSVLDVVISGWPRTSAENSESVRQPLSRSLMNRRTWWWIFYTFNPVPLLSLNMYPGPVCSHIPLLSLNVWFCFNEPGNTLRLFLRCNHLIRVYLTHS